MPALAIRHILLSTLLLLLVGCGGGGSDAPEPPVPDPVGQVDPEPEPEPEPEVSVSDAEAARFLSQASFGPDDASITEVATNGYEAWFLSQLETPTSLQLEAVLATFPDGEYLDENGQLLPQVYFSASDQYWQTIVAGPDQLRQRMAFALSQILVISAEGNLGQFPQMVASYADLLAAGAFGNYRDLIEDVTYSPAMSVYLTYLRNQKADPETGRVPDENYARELLQLFTIGLVELNQDGTPVLDAEGNAVELFDNNDITGLASVFTGLSFSGGSFGTRYRVLPAEAIYQPLRMFNFFHTDEQKQFLGTTIPAGTDGDTSIDLALDAIFAHPNVGPFLGRQLIQRFVTSHPEPAYVARVADAFDEGRYELPSGEVVGTGERGDLSATLAAVLFDQNARDLSHADGAEFGKLREPVLRFTHWARAFEVNSADASNELVLRATNRSDLLGQHPFRAPSVFNFYRPGYVAPGTLTGAAGLTAPELQILNATTLVGYPNVITLYALQLNPQVSDERPAAYVPDYSEAFALASDTEALLNHLDRLLTHGRLQAETRDRITTALETIPLGPDGDSDEGRWFRSRLASIMVMTSPEYMIQK